MALITNLDTARTGRPNPSSYSTSIASFTRPANTTGYTARDILSDDTSTAKAIEFPSCGRSGIILRAGMVYEDNNGGTPDFELYVFDAEPTNFVDNAAVAMVSADMAKLVGSWNFLDADARIVTAAGDDIQMYEMANDESGGSHAYVTASDSDSLYGLLVTGSHTPVSGTKVHLKLHLRIS